MRNGRRARSWIGGALTVLALLLVVGYAAWAAPGATTVEVKQFKFQPASVTVAPGTTVTWLNDDEEPHTITSTDGVFKSPALENAGRFAYTFTEAGTYHYFCAIHPHMRADVVVR